MAGSPQLISTYPETHFGKKVLREENYDFVFEIWVEISWTFSKNAHKKVNTAFYMLIDTFWEKQLWSSLVKKFSEFEWNCFCRFVKSAFHEASGTMQKKTFFFPGKLFET